MLEDQQDLQSLVVKVQAKLDQANSKEKKMQIPRLYRSFLKAANAWPSQVER